MSLLYNFIVSVLRKMNTYDKRHLSYSSTISSLVNDADNEPILDIGVGTGYITNMLYKEKPRLIVGLDIDRNVLKSNKFRLFHPVVADAHHMPFQDEIFAVTLFISCVEHFDHPLACIDETSRITRRNGLCITQLPNLQWLMEPHTKFPLLYFMPRKLSLIIKKSTRYNSLNLSTTLKKVLSWFNHSGFANIYRRAIYHLQIFRLLPWPPGWFLLFRKIGRTPTNDDLIGSYTYYDADGDPENGTEIRWYMNGTLQPQLNDH